MKMTVKDLVRWYHSAAHFIKGYCCYADAGKEKFELLNLGHNSGVYGWNWTLFYDPAEDTLYCSYYRNVPWYLVEK